ncbi:Ig-like domain-containing protein [Brevibacillus agri]|uniref:Ig-like domain-containing protein n=1 Tax=Brevibacillus agri TaxID=51101 RepID=UPI0025B6A47C|nr:Ig-like domain-containing protein [Brevibacillus agri]MDN4094184.1 Ig-like domain-containing protein [Brevibacillus agri]
MINLFQSNPDDFQYILDTIGQNVQINNQSVKVVISNTTLSTDVDDKKISTLTPIERGDIVHYNNEDWLIISEVNGQRNGRYRAFMRVCDYRIKINFGIVKEFPAIVDGRVFDVETGQYMTLPASKILVTLQENQETLKIEAGQRFIKMGRAWKVEAIDRTHKGLLRLWCKQDQFNSAVDDVENEIADARKYVYVVDITNTETTIQQENTLQLNVSVTLNGQSVSGMAITFSSSDTNIATVDTSGLVTAVNPGTVTITAALAEKSDVKDTITLTVEAVQQDNYVLTIVGDPDMRVTQTKTWNAVLTNNGQQVSMQPATWSITNTTGGTTDLVTITNQSNKSCTLKANSNNKTGYFKLICTLNDGSLTSEKQILVKSLI